MALRDIQSRIQEAKAARDKQLAASTAATQSGSTSTPTTTETPKVVQTPKSVQSTIEQRTTNNISNVKNVRKTETNSAPNLKDINLFKIQDVTKTRQQIGQQYGNILSTTQENKDIQSTTIPTSTVNAVIKMGGSALKAVTNTLYKQGEDYAKQRIGAPALNANAFLEGTKLFSTAQGIAGDLTKKAYKDISADIKEEWESGEGVGMIRDFGAYTLEGIPRGITRGEYGLAELLDWAVDAQWATDLKNDIKKDKEYWENTRVYKRASSAESFKDFAKNPMMYAGGTLTEMLPMFISAWVAIPRTYAQVYGETYSDYSQDESLKEAGLTDNQIRLMAAGVAGVNSLIEIGSDLIEGVMPWTRASTKQAEKTIRRRLTRPFANIIKNIVKGGFSEGIEEVLQNEIQEQVAVAAGSDRDLPTRTERLTTFGISAVIGSVLQGGNIMVEIQGHKELKRAFEEWSEAVDDFAPGVSEEDKKKFFSAIIAAEIEDQQMSDKQVNKYQQESTQLYEQKAQLQEQLEQTTDPRVKQSINYQIENIDARIKDIDKSLNQWQNVMEDVNNQLEEISKKSELPAQQATPQQQGGENLSKQTMPNINTIESKKSDTQRYYELSGLGRRQLDLNKSNDAKEAYETVDKLKGMSVDEGGDLLSKYDYDALQLFRTIANNKIRGISEGRIEDDINIYNKILEQIDKAEQIQIDAFSEKHRIRQKGLDEKDVSSVEQYSLVTKGKMFDELDADEKESVIAEFVKQDTNYSKHLVGLKGTSIKDLTGEITDASAHKFSRMIARVSKLLGIDFNKVISGVELNVTKGKKYNSLEGFLTKDYTKEQLTELANRMAVDGEKINKALSGVVKAGIFLAEKKNLSIEKATAILAHEFFHLLDFKKSVDSNKPLVINDKYELDKKGNRRTAVIFDALLEGENIRYTYETNSKREQFVDELLDGTASISDYKKRGFKNKKEAIDVVNYLIYLRRGTEVLSRYTEQYALWKTDKKEFNKITKEAGYWTEDEFNKLKDAYEDVVLKDDFKDYKLDEGNKNYYNLMVKLDFYKGSGKFMNDKEWLKNISEEHPGASNDIKNKIKDLEYQYVKLKSQLDKLEGDISDEIRNEYNLAIDSIEENLELLTTLQDKYTKATKNTSKQQSEINNMTNEAADNANTIISDGEATQEQNDVEDEEIDSNDEPVDIEKPVDSQISESNKVVEEAVDKVITSKDRRNTIHSIGEGFRNVLVPSLTRLYNISPRLAGAIHTYQATKELLTNLYKQKTLKFVDAMYNLKKKNPDVYKKLSLMLFDYGMVDGIDIKAELKRAGIDPQLFEPVAEVLDRIARDYQRVGLDVTINDKYYPRKVKDYELLMDYIFRKSGDKSINHVINIWNNQDMDINEKRESIEDTLNQFFDFDNEQVQNILSDNTLSDEQKTDKLKSILKRKDISKNKVDTLSQIEEINNNANLSEGEKEEKVHSLLINSFTSPSQRSNNAKERKIVLSDWLLTEEEKKQGYVNDIIDFYEDPIKALENYIDDMVKKTELRKMLGGLTKEGTAISEDFDASVSGILLEMQRNGELTRDMANDAEYIIKSIVSSRASGKGTRRIKNATYSLTIANFLSAAQQLEDISKTLLKGPTGFKNVIKALLGKANIKMDDTGLTNMFAQFEGGSITDFLFKWSGFDMVDALGKNSFLNTAYDTCVRKANGNRAPVLKGRLVSMYGEKKGNRIFEKYKDNKLKNDRNKLDLEIMVDLLYQLGSTQPIYQSSMPTAYLNNPKIRAFYCLWSFTIKQVDWLIQGIKDVYNNQKTMGRSDANAALAATGWCVGATIVVSLISALVTDLINTIKGDDDDTVRKNLLENGWEEALKRLGINALSGILKIFNISKYDQYIFEKDGIEGVLASKVTPAFVSIGNDLLQIGMGKEEVSDLGKYGPLFLKPLYYIFKNNDMLPDYKLWGGEAKEKKSKSTSDKFGKTSVGTQGPSNSSKFGGYSVQ